MTTYNMLTDEEIKKFKRLVKKNMNIDLTDAEAEDQGGRLITFFELLIKIDRKNKQKIIVESNKTED